MTENIKGYSYGQVGRSPVSEADLNLLEKTVFFTADDAANLKLAGEILQDQTDDILDLWYGYVGSHEHLIRYFSKGGQPNADYLGAVRLRFKQWILDLCFKPFDQTWLNYQHEIALRHIDKKNTTDGVEAEPFVHYRYMIAFIVPISLTIKEFLAKKGHEAATVDALYQSWFKAIVLTTLLWTYPYVKDGKF
ncbi:protoglobin domain-containing protein [Pedobacter sp. GSP4]|uniref:protoglobin domain-containing protein n=1 Tax=Pedobacter sp. GSP4 TaxID=3453716 RepID=UPI003EF009A6